MTREEITRILKDEYPRLSSAYGVKRIGLFGSYATGMPSEDSDIDLVVEFERPIGFRLIELAERLEAILGKAVELLTPTGIQAIRVQRVERDIEESTVYVA